jgi:hypothetical protein
MFGNIGSRTYFLFGGLNLLWILIVFYIYPETKDRSLEAISMILFKPDSPTYKASEAAWRAHDGDILAGDSARTGSEDVHSNDDTMNGKKKMMMA